MIRSRFKKVLLVAPEIFPNQLVADFADVKRVESVNSIFPALYNFIPDLIILDYDLIGPDTEKIVRRIKMNKFYSKLNICCYKNASDISTDGLLSAIGVDNFIYQEDLLKIKKSRSILSSVSMVADMAIIKLMGAASN